MKWLQRSIFGPAPTPTAHSTPVLCIFSLSHCSIHHMSDDSSINTLHTGLSLHVTWIYVHAHGHQKWSPAPRCKDGINPTNRTKSRESGVVTSERIWAARPPAPLVFPSSSFSGTSAAGRRVSGACSWPDTSTALTAARRRRRRTGSSTGPRPRPCPVRRVLRPTRRGIQLRGFR